MKFANLLLIIIIGTISLYAILLIISDFTMLSNKIINFKTQFIPLILLLVPCGWLALYVRWNLLIKNSDIRVPFRKNLEIYLAGFTLSITPGKVGELIRSQILKTKFGIPRTKTASLVLVEKLYDLVGAVATSITGIWLFHEAGYVIMMAFALLIVIFILISSRRFFNKFINWSHRFRIMSNFLQPLSESYEVIRNSTRGKIVILASLLSVAYWLITSLAVYFVLLAFGINLNYLSVVSTFTASLILGAASFIPGGIGVAEGSLVGLFSLQGIAVSSSLILVILIRIFTLWYGVTIGFIALKLSGVFSIKSPSI